MEALPYRRSWSVKLTAQEKKVVREEIARKKSATVGVITRCGMGIKGLRCVRCPLSQLNNAEYCWLLSEWVGEGKSHRLLQRAMRITLLEDMIK